MYRTDRFKTDVLKLSIALPCECDEKSTALFGLMINMLRNGTEKYPEKSDIIKRLNDLYDSSCSAGGFASGDNMILELSSEMLSESFTNGERVFDGVCELMYQMLFCPKKDENGLFIEERVEREKRVILDRIKSEKNNSKSYAFKRCRELMCAGEPYGISMKSDKIKKITAKEITDYYNNFIKNIELCFSYVGRRSADEVAESLKAYFGEVELSGKPQINRLSAKAESEPKSFEEELEVKQGVLVLGMTTGILMGEEYSHVIPVFNNVYGGTYTSRLFKTVREKMSLCYQISSDFVTTKGLEFVSCGIDVNKRDEAQKAILDELEDLKINLISDEELDVAKKLTLKEYHEMLDFPNAIAVFYFGREIYGSKESISDLIEKTTKITAEDIREVARRIKLHTVFFLKGTAEGEEDTADE